MVDDSDNSNLPAVEPTTDFTDWDTKALAEYIDSGLPFIATIDSTQMARILDLYLSGKTYRQISMIMNVKKVMILYLSKKFNWFTIRREYLVDLESSIRARLMEAKIINQDFLLQMTYLWQKKIGSKINKYLATGDEKHASEIDLKEYDKYLKTVEMLHKLSGDGAFGQKTPAVGLNLGEGVTISRDEDGKIDITPKQKVIGDLLKQFADMRREQENKDE